MSHTALSGAFRSLARHPRFAIAAVVGIGLGLGLFTAAFSVFYGVLLRPLDMAEAGRVFFLFEGKPRSGQSELFLSYPAFLAWQRRSQCFEALGGTAVALVTLSGRGHPEVVKSALVTSEFFRVVGVAPALGRTLGEADGTVLEAVISYDLWRDRFAHDRRVVGRQIQLGDRFFTVVGVMPPGIGTPGKTRIWVPLEAAPALFPQVPDLLTDESSRLLRVMARLAPRFSPEQARRHLVEVARSMARDFPATLRASTRRSAARSLGFLASRLSAPALTCRWKGRPVHLR